MTHHDLKIAPPYFKAVKDGRKTFEIRLDDRGFQAGDTVTLHEFDGEVTGNKHTAVIGYVTNFQQQPGYVVFSLLPIKETNHDE